MTDEQLERMLKLAERLVGVLEAWRDNRLILKTTEPPADHSWVTGVRECKSHDSWLKPEQSNWRS